MFKTVFHRLGNSRWKVLSLLIGLILAIAIAFCIPVYSDGVLQRILIKTLEDVQHKTEEFPSYVGVDYRITGIKKNSDYISAVIEEELSAMDAAMPMDLLVKGKYYKYEMFRRQAGKDLRYENISLTYLENLEEHVNVVTGRMFDPNRSDGIVEVVMNNRYLVKSLYTLNEVYEFESMYKDEQEGLKIMIVGVVEPKDPSDLFWYEEFTDFNGGMFVPNNYFAARIAQNMDFARHLTQFSYYHAYDFYDLQTDTAAQATQVYRTTAENLDNRVAKKLTTFNIVNAVDEFIATKETVQVSMYILTIPIFILLAFYIIMVSRLKLQSEQSEISVMQSRGAGKLYILGLYLIECLILMVCALLIGPFVGRFLCEVIGASNGFLEFVNRKALDFRLVPAAFYSIAAVALLFIIITMVPAFFGANVTIVQSKRRHKKNHTPFYHKYFIDILFLGISIYGFTSMEKQRQMLEMLLEEGTVITGSSDVLTYLSSTLFALGAGMLFLRVYPQLVKIVFWIGRRFWPAWAYAAVNRVARNRDAAHIMLFLIATVSVGIFSTDAAQSINNHVEKNVRATYGCDLCYRPVWQKYDDNGNLVLGHAENDGNIVKIYDEGELIQSYHVSYNEILAQTFTEFDEIDAAARVYREYKATIRGGKGMQDIQIMYIDPYEFGTVAFSTSTMNDYHLNEYLNVMALDENAMIVSKNILESRNLKPGDMITVSASLGSITGTIIAGVDSWPGFEKYYETDRGRVYETSFVVANLSKAFFEHEVRPYSFWLKRADGVTDKDVFNVLSESEHGLTSLESANQEVIEEKNSPVLQGTNGLLSVSFIAALIICAIGFMIYWILSIKSRTLLFGISRALGMSKGGIMKMLCCEQLLVSGVAVAAGVLIGKIGSMLFVPMLAINYTSAEDIIPFRVVATKEDLIRVCVIMAILLVICITCLTVMVIRQKIDRAVKMGEE